jgi:hypothetical protein
MTSALAGGGGRARGDGLKPYISENGIGLGWDLTSIFALLPSDTFVGVWSLSWMPEELETFDWEVEKRCLTVETCPSRSKVLFLFLADGVVGSFGKGLLAGEDPFDGISPVCFLGLVKGSEVRMTG